ncbi:hypothetical protein BV898_19930, partial [Hypsibius exemplaris]
AFAIFGTVNPTALITSLELLWESQGYRGSHRARELSLSPGLPRYLHFPARSFRRILTYRRNHVLAYHVPHIEAFSQRTYFLRFIDDALCMRYV